MTTRYFSPSGSGSTCSSATPCSFATARNASIAGDTMIGKDGTYTSSFDINCGSNAVDGTAGNPIILRAENERKVFINGDGSFIPIRVQNCSYWNFHGIYAKSADVISGADGLMECVSCDHLTIQRMLLVHPNRYQNDHCLLIWQGSGNHLIEENEGYDFFRHGINLKEDNSIIRRNYLNSRGAVDLPGSPNENAGAGGQRGDAAITAYPGINNIIENNISEGQYTAYDLEALGTTSDNKLLGNISIGDNFSIFFQARGNGIDFMPQNNIIRDHVVIGTGTSTDDYGLYIRSAKNTQISQISIRGTGEAGIVADKMSSPSEQGDGSPTIFVTNASIYPSRATYDFGFFDQSSFSCDYCAGVGTFSPAVSNSNITHEFTSTPTNLGGCYCWIPDTSNLKGAGLNGADIGATILYRYEDGILTGEPLWDVTDGSFPHGALVSGVNDIASSSLFDVHIRLNINTQSCPFPASYVGSRTFYVAKNGNDTNTGAFGSPKLTIAAGVALLSPGDTLIIGPGVYIEALRDVIPPGTSSSNPTIVRASVPNSVILRPTSGTDVVRINADDITVVDIHADAISCSGLPFTNLNTGSGTDSLKLEACTARNSSGLGMSIRGNNNKLFSCLIAKNDATLEINGDSNLVFNCGIYENGGSYGTWISGGSGNQVINHCTFGNTANNLLNNGTNTIQNNNNLGIVDPLFVDAPNGDYSLRAGSPLINAGETKSSYFTRDLYGRTRG